REGEVKAMSGSDSALLRCFRAGIAVLMVLAASGALAPQPAEAVTTLVVDKDGQASATDCNANQPAFTVIQDAVNAASAGGRILICPGTYADQVVVSTNNLTIRGTGQSVAVLRPTSLPV